MLKHVPAMIALLIATGCASDDWLGGEQVSTEDMSQRLAAAQIESERHAAAVEASRHGVSADPVIASGSVPPTDREFAQRVVSSNLLGIRSSQLAVTRSQDLAITQSARRLLDDYTRADNQLRKLAARKDIQLADKMTASQEAELAKLQSLRGEEFDEAYHDAQVMLQNDIVSLLDNGSRELHDDDLRSLASKTLPIFRENEDELRMDARASLQRE